DVDVLGPRQIADRRFHGAHSSFAAVDDPTQNAQVVAESGPQEFAGSVASEPVDVENLRQLVGTLLKAQPMSPVVAVVVAAERLHRHRVAAYDADFARGRGSRLGRNACADQHAMRPVLRLIYER